jgi:hypothetical protein
MSWQRIFAELKPLDDDVQLLQKKAAEEDSAGQVKLLRASGRNRSEYQQKQWRVTRIQKIFTSGGMGMKHAKLIATRINANNEELTDTHPVPAISPPSLVSSVSRNAPMAEFNPGLLSMWDSTACQLVASFNNVINENKELVESKKKAVMESLSNNASWASSMGVMKNIDMTDALAVFGNGLELVKNEGSQPWMVCMRTNKVRSGPAGYPMPGVATLFHSINFSLHVHITRIADVIGKVRFAYTKH